MKVFGESVCPDCGECFESVSSALKHFAHHVLEHKLKSSNVASTPHNFTAQKDRNVPDLHPISKDTPDECDEIHPITFCKVTITEENVYSKESSCKAKKKCCKCTYCEKKFNSFVALKKHIVKHTVERPFKCQKCSLSFTKRFLLNRHLAGCDKKIPDLKPISLITKIN